MARAGAPGPAGGAVEVEAMGGATLEAGTGGGGARAGLAPGSAAALRPPPGEEAWGGGVRASVLLATGGSVTALALAPTPPGASLGGAQYLAVGVEPDLFDHDPSRPVSRAGRQDSIQVWKLRPEAACTVNHSEVREGDAGASCSYCVSHRRGPAIHMEFCPPAASSRAPAKRRGGRGRGEPVLVGRLGAVFGDGSLAVWDLSDGGGGTANLAGSTDYVFSTMDAMPLRLAWRTAADCTEIAVTCSNGTVVVFGVVEEATLGGVELRVRLRIAVDAQALRCIRWLPESDAACEQGEEQYSPVFVAGGVSGKLFVVDTRAPDLPLAIFPCGKGFVQDVAYSAEFKAMVSAHDWGLLRVWDLAKSASGRKKPHNCTIPAACLKSLAPSYKKKSRGGASDGMVLFCAAGGAAMRVDVARQGEGGTRYKIAPSGPHATKCLGTLEWEAGRLKVDACPGSGAVLGTGLAGPASARAESYHARADIQWARCCPVEGSGVHSRGAHTAVFGCRGGLVWWKVVA